MPRSVVAIATVLVLVAGCGDDAVELGAPPSSMPSTSTVAVLGVEDRLEAEREWYRAPGALALVRVGSEEWWGASGSADLAGSALSGTTTFRIASITKPIVAALVVDAVRRGELSLEDVVSDLLPGVIRPEPPITVRMLLDHTSGMFNEGDDGDVIADMAKLTDPVLKAEAAAVLEAFQGEGQIVASPELIVALAETNDRYFEPGAGHHYANVNYQLAAMVLEDVTGLRIDELLRTRIVEPLGLTDTYLAPFDRTSPDMRGYGTAVSDGTLVDMTDDLVTFGNGGSGGVVSTAGELLTIMQSIVGGSLVGPELTAAMKMPTKQSYGSYGLGLATYYLTCGVFYGHEGGVNGQASIAIVTDDGAAGVVVALNLRDGSDPKLPALADALLCDRL